MKKQMHFCLMVIFFVLQKELFFKEFYELIASCILMALKIHKYQNLSVIVFVLT